MKATGRIPAPAGRTNIESHPFTLATGNMGAQMRPAARLKIDGVCRIPVNLHLAL